MYVVKVYRRFGENFACYHNYGDTSPIIRFGIILSTNLNNICDAYWKHCSGLLEHCFWPTRLPGSSKLWQFWSPLIPDLNFCVFFSRSFLKDRLFPRKPSDEFTMRRMLVEMCRRIVENMCCRIITNLCRRL